MGDSKTSKNEKMPHRRKQRMVADGGVRSERGNAENSGLKAVVEGRVLGTNNREGNSEGRVWTTIRSQQHTRCAGRQASGGVIDNNK